MADEKTPSVFGGGAVSMVNPDQLVKALDESASKDPRGGTADGSDYGSFSGKLGKYSLGQDKADADPEELWVVNISSFQDGWICWRNNSAVATRTYPLGADVPTPDMDEHGPFTNDGDGWYQLKAMTFKSIDTGQQVYFKNNSTSGVSEMAKLQKDVVANIRAGLPCFPVISLHKASFTAQGRNNFKPIFKVDGWLSGDAMQKLASAIESEEDFDLDELYEYSAQNPAVGGTTEEPEEEPEPEQEPEAPPKKPTARRNKRI